MELIICSLFDIMGVLRILFFVLTQNTNQKHATLSVCTSDVAFYLVLFRTLEGLIY